LRERHHSDLRGILPKSSRRRSRREDLSRRAGAGIETSRRESYFQARRARSR